eukprot:Clim_evm1s224 gene=Clim_evmTU1s224
MKDITSTTSSELEHQPEVVQQRNFRSKVMAKKPVTLVIMKALVILASLGMLIATLVLVVDIRNNTNDTTSRVGVLEGQLDPGWLVVTKDATLSCEDQGYSFTGSYDIETVSEESACGFNNANSAWCVANPGYDNANCTMLIGEIAWAIGARDYQVTYGTINRYKVQMMSLLYDFSSLYIDVYNCIPFTDTTDLKYLYLNATDQLLTDETNRQISISCIDSNYTTVIDKTNVPIVSISH